MIEDITFLNTADPLELVMCGTLEHNDIEQLKTQIEYALEQGATELTINLSSVRLVDSVTLGFFAWLHHVFEGCEGMVRFEGVTPELREVFDTVGFITHSRVFSFVDLETDSESLKTSYDQIERPLGAQDLLKIEHRVFYPSSYELAQMRTFLDEFLVQAPLTDAQRDDIRIAASEAFANAITHGSKGVETPYVRVELRLYTQLLVIDVFNNGMAFGGTYESSQDIFRLHGRGILLMRELADRVEFIPEVDDSLMQGTTVRIIKRLDAC